MITIESRSGTYALILRVGRIQTIQVGALGNIEFDPGYYVYVGSAFGPGGLCARLAHHLMVSQRAHWHIDYLRQHAEPSEIWYTYDSIRREHEWARTLAQMTETYYPIPEFGASDCACRTHLFGSQKEPDFKAFYEDLISHDPEHAEMYRSVIHARGKEDL